MSTTVPGETPDPLTIGELARWSNVTAATLRHYEDLGLLTPIDPLADPRRYDGSTIGLVGILLLLHEVGFTPREMRELIDARSGSPRSWRQLTERKIDTLGRRIAAARLARDALEHALGCEHEGIVDCPRFREMAVDGAAPGALARPEPDPAPALAPEPRAEPSADPSLKGPCTPMSDPR
jgi:DNA-binding transcriptional MerR regulator